MRKTTYKFVAAIMAVLVAVTCCSAFAFAKGKKNTPSFQNYVVIGDSIAAGYGMTGDPNSLLEQFNLPAGVVVPGTYPELVGKALNANTTNTSRCAYTLANYLRFLDPEYEAYINKPENYWERFLTICNYFQPELFGVGDYSRQKSAVCAAVENADIITINLGNNDTATNALFSPIYKYLYYTVGMSANAAFAAAQNELQVAQSLDEIVLMVGRGDRTLGWKSILQELDYNIALYKKNYDKLVAAIRKINPNAQIYTLGMYDTFRLADPQGSDIQKLCSEASVKVCDEIGTYIKNESPYKDVAHFVDVTNTECHPSAPMTTPNFWLHYLVHCHPDANGHQYIADQILQTINKYN